MTCTKLQNSTHLQLLDVLQLRPSIQQFPIPKLSTCGRQQPDENLWTLSMVLMLGSLSWPSGSSKLDMVKWMRETKLEKDVESNYYATWIYLKWFLPFSPSCREIYTFISILSAYSIWRNPNTATSKGLTNPVKGPTNPGDQPHRRLAGAPIKCREKLCMD